MKFYCGIDLSARDCHVCVIDEQLKLMVQQKVRNELPKIVKLLEPYKANLKIVVESTFNWYWLIDGLQAEGFEVVLAHTLGLYLIMGAKVKTDVVTGSRCGARNSTTPVVAGSKMCRARPSRRPCGCAPTTGSSALTSARSRPRTTRRMRG